MRSTVLQLYALKRKVEIDGRDGRFYGTFTGTVWLMR